MIKELREDYRKCFTNSALSSTAKRFSPTTLQFNEDKVQSQQFSRLPLSALKDGSVFQDLKAL